MTGHLPSSAASVANEFLSLGAAEPNVPFIDQMKLQKLLFYAQAWHLAYNGEPLFEEDFEAWPWGPVVRDVYAQTSGYGRGPVTGRIQEIRTTGPNTLDVQFYTPEGVNENLKPFIRSVWDSHKALTGIQLSNSTHFPGEPWTIIKDKYGTLASKPTIPTALIESVFKKKLTDANTQRTA